MHASLYGAIFINIDCTKLELQEVQDMIIYFSGTGNSRYIAKRIADNMRDELIDANDKIKRRDTRTIQVNDRLVVVTPTYAWRIPWLMGELAESVIEAGGEATGVEPQFFIDAAVQYEKLTELIVTKNMEERKAKMIELGDAFIAFPGGTGTLEEIAEVMSKVSLKHLEAPCILYNLNGYYNSLKELLEHMIEKGLSTKERQEGIYFAENLEEIKQILMKIEK